MILTHVNCIVVLEITHTCLIKLMFVKSMDCKDCTSSLYSIEMRLALTESVARSADPTKLFTTAGN